MSTGSYYARYPSLNNIIIVPTVDFGPQNVEKKDGHGGLQNSGQNVSSGVSSVDSSKTTTSFEPDSAETETIDLTKPSPPTTPVPPEGLPAPSKTPSIKELSSSKYKSRNNLVDLTGFNLLKKEKSTNKSFDSKNKEEKVDEDIIKTDNEVIEVSGEEQNLTMESGPYASSFQQPYQPLQEPYPPFQVPLQSFQPMQDPYQVYHGIVQSFQPLQEAYHPFQQTFQPLQMPFHPLQDSCQPLQESYPPFQEPYQPIQESYHDISNRDDTSHCCEGNTTDRSTDCDVDMEDKMKKYFKHLWNRRIERLKEKSNAEKVSKRSKVVEHSKSSKYDDRERAKSKIKYKKISHHRDEIDTRIRFKDTSKEYQDFVRKFRGRSRSKSESGKHSSSREKTRGSEYEEEEYLNSRAMKRYRDFQRFMENYKGEYINKIPRNQDNAERKKTPFRKHQEERKNTPIRKHPGEYKNSPIRKHSEEYKKAPIRKHSEEYKKSPIRKHSEEYKKSPIRKHQEEYRKSPIRKHSEEYKKSPIRKHQEEYKESPIRKHSEEYKGSPIRKQQEEYKAAFRECESSFIKSDTNFLDQANLAVKRDKTPTETVREKSLKSVVQTTKQESNEDSNDKSVDQQDLRAKLSRKRTRTECITHFRETDSRDILKEKQENETLLITVKQDVKSNSNTKKTAPVPNKKPKANKFKKLKLVINIKCGESGDSDDSEQSSNELCTSPQDFSFLDDINVDEIVDSLSTSNKDVTKCENVTTEPCRTIMITSNKTDKAVKNINNNEELTNNDGDSVVQIVSTETSPDLNVILPELADTTTANKTKHEIKTKAEVIELDDSEETIDLTCDIDSSLETSNTLEIKINSNESDNTQCNKPTLNLKKPENVHFENAFQNSNTDCKTNEPFTTKAFKDPVEVKLENIFSDVEDDLETNMERNIGPLLNTSLRQEPDLLEKSLKNMFTDNPNSVNTNIKEFKSNNMSINTNNNEDIIKTNSSAISLQNSDNKASKMSLKDDTNNLEPIIQQFSGQTEKDLINKAARVNNSNEKIVHHKRSETINQQNVLHTNKRASSAHLKINRMAEKNQSKRTSIDITGRHSKEKNKYSDTRNTKTKTTQDLKSTGSRVLKKENVDKQPEINQNKEQHDVKETKTVSNLVSNQTDTEKNNKYVKNARSKENNKSIKPAKNRNNHFDKVNVLNKNSTIDVTPTKSGKEYRDNPSRKSNKSDKLVRTEQRNHKIVNTVHNSTSNKTAPEEYHKSHKTANSTGVIKGALKPNIVSKKSSKTLKEHGNKLPKDLCNLTKPMTKIAKPVSNKTAPKDNEKHLNITNNKIKKKKKKKITIDEYLKTRAIRNPSEKLTETKQTTPVQSTSQVTIQENASNEFVPKENVKTVNNTENIDNSVKVQDAVKNTQTRSENKANLLKRFIEFKKRLKLQQSHPFQPTASSDKIASRESNKNNQCLKNNDTNKQPNKNPTKVNEHTKSATIGIAYKQVVDTVKQTIISAQPPTNLLKTNDVKKVNKENRIENKITMQPIKVNDHLKTGSDNIVPKQLAKTENLTSAQLPANLPKTIQEIKCSKIDPKDNKASKEKSVENKITKQTMKVNDAEKIATINIVPKKSTETDTPIPELRTYNFMKNIEYCVLTKQLRENKTVETINVENNTIKPLVANSYEETPVKSDKVEEMQQKAKISDKVVKIDQRVETIEIDQEDDPHKIIPKENKKAIKINNVETNTTKESLKAIDCKKTSTECVKENVVKLPQKDKIRTPECEKSQAVAAKIITQERSKCLQDEIKTSNNNDKAISINPPNINPSVQKEPLPQTPTESSQKPTASVDDNTDNLQKENKSPAKNTIDEKNTEVSNKVNTNSTQSNSSLPYGNTKKVSNEAENSNQINMNSPSKSLKETCKTQPKKDPIDKSIQSENKTVDHTSNTNLNAFDKANVEDVKKPIPQDNITNETEENNIKSPITNKKEPIITETAKTKETISDSEANKKPESKVETKSGSVTKPKQDSIENNYSSAKSNTEINKKVDETTPKREEHTFSKKFKSLIDEMESRMYNYFHRKYTITSQIHYGYHTVIYKCKDDKGKIYSVKMLHSTAYKGAGIKKDKMFTEVQKHISKDNSCLLYLISGFNVKGHWCFLTEYYPQNLAQALEIYGKSFHIDTVQILSRQLVAAVNMLTGNEIIHSDIKPTHILLNNSLTRLKLAGFDRCDYYHDFKMMPSTGSPSYRAPELILGYQADYRIDVWSTALVMFEMATNNKLFPGTHNNDILYKQICTLGSFEVEMIENSIFRHHYFVGMSFRRTFPYQASEDKPKQEVEEFKGCLKCPNCQKPRKSRKPLLQTPLLQKPLLQKPLLQTPLLPQTPQMPQKPQMPRQPLFRCLVPLMTYTTQKKGISKKSMMVHAFHRNNKFRGQIFTTYSNEWKGSRTKWQVTEDLDKLDTFHRLLQKMLTLDPKHRLPIQFVEANEFIHDMFA